MRLTVSNDKPYNPMKMIDNHKDNVIPVDDQNAHTLSSRVFPLFSHITIKPCLVGAWIEPILIFFFFYGSYKDSQFPQYFILAFYLYWKSFIYFSIPLWFVPHSPRVGELLDSAYRQTTAAALIFLCWTGQTKTVLFLGSSHPVFISW